MPTYIYKAVDKTGKYIKGKIIAETEAEVEKAVSKAGRTLISVQEIVKKKREFGLKRITRVRTRSLITFTYQLATYLDSGVPLMSALYDLSNNPEDPKMGVVAFEIYKSLEGGSSFEDSLKGFPKIFSTLYVGAVRSGETTGNLPEVLKYLSKYLEWQGQLKAQVKQAMIYPSILFTAIGGAVTLLVTFVFPKFVSIFKGMDIELPLPTKFLIFLSDFLRFHWKGVIMTIIFLTVILFSLIRTKKGRYLFDQFKLRLPIFGKLIKKVCVSRFAHTFSMSLKAGIDVLRALQLCEAIVGNKVLEKDLTSVREKVNMGENLANSFKDTKEFPPLVMRMVGVGETSGSLEVTVAKVSEYYDNEVPKTIAQIFALMEPLLIVIMGLGVGFVAFSIFVPMFSLVNVARLH